MAKAAPNPQEDLARKVQANPFAFISFEECGELFNFGKDVMTGLAKVAGFPVVARKVNPGLVLEWLKHNADKLN